MTYNKVSYINKNCNSSMINAWISLLRLGHMYVNLASSHCILSDHIITLSQIISIIDWACWTRGHPHACRDHHRDTAWRVHKPRPIFHPSGSGKYNFNQCHSIHLWICMAQYNIDARQRLQSIVTEFMDLTFRTICVHAHTNGTGIA